MANNNQPTKWRAIDKRTGETEAIFFNQTKNQTIMRESGWYPPGAEFDPNAPYNQVEQEEKEYNIEAVFELRRTDDLWSNDYDEFDNLRDPQGEWTSTHMTPLELIAECKQLARTMLDSIDDTATPMGVRARQHLLKVIAECDGWVENYNEFNEE